MMRPASRNLPVCAGIGLRAQHYRDALEGDPLPGWVEVHSENFFEGGAPLHTLLAVRDRRPVSLHGVGMGLASPGPLNRNHLDSLKRLCEKVQPAAVSEHLCWNFTGKAFLNDLLPFPHTFDSLNHVAAKVNEVQDALGRQLLVENLSSHVTFSRSEMGEAEFLAELARRTGCGILFDVNNLYVSSRNLGIDAESFILALPQDAVMEYHLAGHGEWEGILVDTHGDRVCGEVWELYESALHRIGSRPTLIEWDNDIPELSVLLQEAGKAQSLMERHHEFLA